jgi:hypothetical protein
MKFTISSLFTAAMLLAFTNVMSLSAQNLLLDGDSVNQYGRRALQCGRMGAQC